MSIANEGASDGRPLSRSDVTVWLTCGCTIALRNVPLSKTAKYPCRNNMGHGYTLVWTKWRNNSNGRTKENK